MMLFVLFPCFVVLSFVSFLVLQSSCWGGECGLLFSSVVFFLLCVSLCLTVSWVGLCSVIVVFPGHTHLF